MERFNDIRRISSCVHHCHLAVVHTPADWGPHEIYSIADKVPDTFMMWRLGRNSSFSNQVKKLNKEAGLNSFVLLVGTGLQNVHMSIEALQRLEI